MTEMKSTRPQRVEYIGFADGWSTRICKRRFRVPAEREALKYYSRRFRVTCFVIHLQPLEQGRFRWIKAERLHLLGKPIASFRIIVRPGRYDLVAPALDLILRFLFAVSVKPFNHFLIARALLDLRLEIVAFHAFEAKEHVIHRTIEMIFPDVAGHESAAFVNRASKNRVAADANARTTRRFPR